MVRRVVTDKPELTGYLDGYSNKGRRQPTEESQKQQYEKGFRKGAKNSYKDQLDT